MIRQNFVKLAIEANPEQRKIDIEFFRRIHRGEIKLDKRQNKVMMPDGSPLRSLGYDWEEFAQELADQGIFGGVK